MCVNAGVRWRDGVTTPLARRGFRYHCEKQCRFSRAENKVVRQDGQYVPTSKLDRYRNNGPATVGASAFRLVKEHLVERIDKNGTPKLPAPPYGCRGIRGAGLCGGQVLACLRGPTDMRKWQRKAGLSSPLHLIPCRGSPTRPTTTPPRVVRNRRQPMTIRSYGGAQDRGDRTCSSSAVSESATVPQNDRSLPPTLSLSCPSPPSARCERSAATTVHQN